MKNMNKNRLSTVLFICLAIALIMTACMNKTGMDETPAPTMTAAASPSVTPKTTVETQSFFDWSVNGEAIEKNLSRISELSEARVIVNDSTALVAVKLNPAYKGEVTDRIREMIASEITKADAGIQNIIVTAEETDVSRAYAISDRMRAGETLEKLKGDIENLFNNLTGRV